MTTIERTVAEIPRALSSSVAEAVGKRWDSLTKPQGSLGSIETGITKLAWIQNKVMPEIDRPCVYVFCADHGITEEGVSLYPSVVTREMVRNFVRGGAAINVLCRQLGIATRIVDAGVAGPRFEQIIDRRVAEGTRNFLRGPAMSQAEAVTAVESGIELGRDAAESFNLVGVGEMGIGNSTSASALLCAFTGATPEEAAGRGAGLDEAGVGRKREVLSTALALHQVDRNNALEVLAAFGGFEIAMMAGFILGAASKRVPVVMDGFISGAAFLAARVLYRDIGEYVFFGHRSAEAAHMRLLHEADAHPLLDLGMRLGEGTGAALAMGVLVSGLSLYREMATFAEASVSDVEKDFEKKEQTTK